MYQVSRRKEFNDATLWQELTELFRGGSDSIQVKSLIFPIHHKKFNPIHARIFRCKLSWRRP